LLEAAGYDLRAVEHGYGPTLEDILIEQCAEPAPTR
jgi:hypothetical protein